jgi:hypothetical protein
MDALDPIERPFIKSLTASTPEALVSTTDVEHLRRVAVGDPKDVRDILVQLIESLVALAQRGNKHGVLKSGSLRIPG